ncbi:MAG TPA: (d)CMP kinase [Ignavibacteriaceae bacterium]|jgi:cytidylate kinase
MPQKLIVAIDGPAGSGKSTTAILVAQKLGYLYIDTGAMYRAITFLAIKNNLYNEEEIIKLAENTDLRLDFVNGKTKVFVDDNEITEDIRMPEINARVSEVSKIEAVRKILVRKQREMGSGNRGVVMEGRDIGTVVFPDADIKVFMTASLDERARRRKKEYIEKNIDISLDEVKKNLMNRDEIDSGRKVSPLTIAEGAVEVNTSEVSIDEQVNVILKEIKKVADTKGVSLTVN